MQYYNAILYKRINDLCEKRGITINRLAKLSDVSQSTIASLATGDSKNPTLRTIHKIANAFNMTLAEFLDFPELNAYSFEDETEET